MENKSLFEHDEVLPRGIRNCNPLNIKYYTRNRWKGLAGSDGVFCTFVDPSYGFRAAAKLVHTYLKRSPDLTLNSFIHIWCPDETSNSYYRIVFKHIFPQATDSWLEYVTYFDLGNTSYNKLSDLISQGLLPKIFEGMCIVENGYCPYDLEFIRKSIYDVYKV